MINQKLKAAEYLRDAARQIQDNMPYQWGHMGSCNCGHLAQVITKESKAEIHRKALLTRSGDWTEQLNDYCPASGLPMDLVIDEVVAQGFTRSELQHLEKLDDPKVLNSIPADRKPLRHNCKEDAIYYMHAWANLLEGNFDHDKPLNLNDSDSDYTISVKKNRTVLELT